MFTKSVMIPKHKMFYVEESVSVKETLQKLKEHKIDGMPVLSGNRYVGLITRHAIYEAAFNSNLSKEEFMEKVSVGSIVIKKDNTAVETDVFEDTLLKVKDVPLVPVVDDKGQCLGIVTRFDVLSQFQSVFGMNKKGVRIVVSSVETEGRILRLSEVIRQFHQNIISLTTFDDSDKLVRRIVMKVEYDKDTDLLLKGLEKNGFKVLSVKKTD
ncbi:MAG: CBS domain-containing protein [Tuberibacillus sp.]